MRVDDLGDIAAAWLTWSIAAENALAGAHTEARGVVPATGLKTGRGKLKMRSVGSPKVCKSRSNFTDPTDGRNVWFCRNCSV